MQMIDFAYKNHNFDKLVENYSRKIPIYEDDRFYRQNQSFDIAVTVNKIVLSVLGPTRDMH